MLCATQTVGIPDPAAVEAEPFADSDMAAPTGIPVTPAFERDTQASPFEPAIRSSSASFLTFLILAGLEAQTQEFLDQDLASLAGSPDPMQSTSQNSLY